jgi:REP element-mobilizing transposase RayT
MLAWVVMPDHVHLLLRLGGNDSLPVVMNRINSCTAKAANRALSRMGPVWQGAYHDRAMRADEHLANVARYLVANPLRAGLADRVGDYPYWNIAFAETSDALLDQL